MDSMQLKDLVSIHTASINPMDAPEKLFHLYSLPSFDDNRKREEVLGRQIHSNKSLVPNRCILFNKLNVRFQRIWLIDNDDADKICSTEFLPLIVDENKIDFYYCYFLLHAPSITNYLTGQNTNTSGSHKRIDPDDFLSIEVQLPSLPEQKRIGKFLFDIEQKIIVNRQINDYLEAMARQLYDYWFVQFDFPDESGNPYKSTGGKMVWNDTLKREIPEGWSNGVLGDYIGRITNGLNPRSNFILGNGNNYYITIRSLTGTDIDWDNCDKCDDVALRKINSRSQLQIGDIVFSAIGTIGRTYLIQEQPRNWNISETSFTLRPTSGIPSEFLYSLLRSDEIQLLADKAAMGSTLRCLVMESLKQVPIVLIPEFLTKRFGGIVKTWYSQIYSLNKQVRELREQRDSIMPLLMNGQVFVKPLNNHLSHD